MSIPVVTILKLDSKLTNLGLWEDIWDPLNDKGRWLLLIWGSVTNFEEGFSAPKVSAQAASLCGRSFPLCSLLPLWGI